MNHKDTIVNKLPGITRSLLRIYIQWHKETKRLSKDVRYSLGIKMSTLFTELIECTSLAQFASEKNKGVYLERAIMKNDVLKYMFYVLFELDSLSEKNFIEYSISLEEIGRMLYGWKRKYESQKTAH
jgi:hypothetical protein